MKNSAQGNEESESIVLKPKRDKAFILLYLSHHRTFAGFLLTKALKSECVSAGTYSLFDCLVAVSRRVNRAT